MAILHIPLGGLGNLEVNLHTRNPTTMLINTRNHGMFQIGKTGHLSIPRSTLNTSSGLRVGRDKLLPSFLQFPCPISNIPNLHLMSSNYCQDILLHLFHLFLSSHNTFKMLPLRDLQYFQLNQYQIRIIKQPSHFTI
jgi:hypothetical protein